MLNIITIITNSLFFLIFESVTIMDFLKYLGISCSSLLCSYVGYHAIRRVMRNLKLRQKLQENKVLFFTAANARCRKTCLEKKKSCGPTCSLLQLKEIVNQIENVQESLDVCMYLITCNDLTRAIINAYNRNVKVRVIVDHDMVSSSESKIRWFKEAGLPIRSISTAVLMHHKFCILDYETENQKLITGSLNWTLQGLAGNYEYVSIITTQQPIDAYEEEFNQMWDSFNPLL